MLTTGEVDPNTDTKDQVSEHENLLGRNGNNQGLSVTEVQRPTKSQSPGKLMAGQGNSPKERDTVCDLRAG